jgi:hypothetical protein
MIYAYFEYIKQDKLSCAKIYFLLMACTRIFVGQNSTGVDLFWQRNSFKIQTLLFLLNRRSFPEYDDKNYLLIYGLTFWHSLVN